MTIDRRKKASRRAEPSPRDANPGSATVRSATAGSADVGDTQPSVTIVVPVYRDWVPVRGLLDALLQLEDATGLDAVVIVDNGPFDSEYHGQPRVNPERPALPTLLSIAGVEVPVRCVVEPKPGSYVARNRGAEACQSDLLAFLDADCRPRPNWLRAGRLAFARDAAMHVLAGHIDVTCVDPAQPTAAELYEIAGAFDQRRNVAVKGFGVTAHLWVRRSTFSALGGFRADLRSGGDYEFGLRLKAASYRLVYADAVRVEHPARRSLGALLRRHRRIASGNLQREPHGYRRSWARLARSVYSNAIPDPAELLRRVGHPKLQGPGQRWVVLVTHVGLHYLAVLERLRVVCGGKVPRA